jgi:hypothetical protein
MRPLVRSCAPLLGCPEALRHVNGGTSSLSRLLCINQDIRTTMWPQMQQPRNPGANICLASVAAVSGDNDDCLLRVLAV